jgi:putative membrane protein
MADSVTAASSSAQINTELAMRRTGMSFQRTRMSADRTLMSVIRTSLSLIGFGFTIFQFFNKLKDAGVLKGAAPARNFGTSLVLLGIGMLILGIIYHVMFMLGLRRQRSAMKAEGIVHGESGFPTSLVLIVAVLLLLIGVVAVISMVGHVGPYS